jgi:hypothetical protein
MFCLYTLPLARPAQDKIQMATPISSIVKYILPRNLVNLSHLYLLKGGHVFASFRELSLFHTLSDIPEKQDVKNSKPYFQFNKT